MSFRPHEGGWMTEFIVSSKLSAEDATILNWQNVDV